MRGHGLQPWPRMQSALGEAVALEPHLHAKAELTRRGHGRGIFAEHSVKGFGGRHAVVEDVVGIAEYLVVLARPVGHVHIGDDIGPDPQGRIVRVIGVIIAGIAKIAADAEFLRD